VRFIIIDSAASRKQAVSLASIWDIQLGIWIKPRGLTRIAAKACSQLREKTLSGVDTFRWSTAAVGT
jgi:hypothetical protein